MSGIEDKKPILSICIPTWNRAKFLDISLKSFVEQIVDIDTSELELYVSDNRSDDNTPDIVKLYIEQGLPIIYNRNEENLGAAGNFVKCMQWASGKYILLLGDDDILETGSVKYILNQLRGNDYGLVHIHQYKKLKEERIVYDNLEDFYKQISFWFTFMSGSIFRKDVVNMIDSSKYVKTHLLQMPYYLKSATLGNTNLLLNKSLMKEGLDSSNNGGYNFYEVFVKNYLNIWQELVDENLLSKVGYEYIKRDIYVNFIIRFNYNLLICRRNIMSESKEYIGNRKGLKIAGAKDILKQYYGGYCYSVLSFLKYPQYVLSDLIRIIKKII